MHMQMCPIASHRSFTTRALQYVAHPLLSRGDFGLFVLFFRLRVVSSSSSAAAAAAAARRSSLRRLDERKRRLVRARPRRRARRQPLDRHRVRAAPLRPSHLIRPPFARVRDDVRGDALARRRADGRSIQANVGVELKGVSWS